MKPEAQISPHVPARANVSALDWGIGSYESLAAQLLPAARVVVESAGLRPDERVLDLGCGSGNAALLAVEHSGEVTGVDPASRLLEVARAQAAREGKKVTFLPGEAVSLPVGDSSVDVILSVFALIFVPDPGAAAAEMSRVLAPAGRIVLSAWMPAGAMFEMTSTAADAVRQAVGAPPEPAPFAWEQRDALLNLLAPRGFSVEVTHHALAFTASSAQEFLDDQARPRNTPRQTSLFPLPYKDSATATTEAQHAVAVFSLRCSHVAASTCLMRQRLRFRTATNVGRDGPLGRPSPAARPAVEPYPFVNPRRTDPITAPAPTSAASRVPVGR